MTNISILKQLEAYGIVFIPGTAAAPACG